MSNKNPSFSASMKNKSGDDILIEAKFNRVELETKHEFMFMTPDQAIDLASILLSAAEVANEQLGLMQQQKKPNE